MAVPFILDENAIRTNPVLQIIRFERLLKELLTLLRRLGWTLPDAALSYIDSVIQFNDAQRMLDPRIRQFLVPETRQLPDLVASCPLASAGENNTEAETVAAAAAAAAAISQNSTVATVPDPVQQNVNAVGAARPVAVDGPREDVTMVRTQNFGGALADRNVTARAASNASSATRARAANATRTGTTEDYAALSAQLVTARDVMLHALRSSQISHEHVGIVHAAALAADTLAARIANDIAARTAGGPAVRPATAAAARAASAPAANASAARAANAPVVHAANAPAARAANAPVVHAAGAPAADPRALTLQVELCPDCFYHGDGRKLKVIGVTRLERTTTAAAAAAEGHQHQHHVVPVLADDADLIHHISAACRNLAQLPTEDHHAERHHDHLSQSRETAGYGSIVAKHLAKTLLNRSMIESSILTAVFVVVGLKMFDRR